MKSTLPLIGDYEPHKQLFVTSQGAVTQREFLGAVHSLAAKLPNTPYIVNMCEDRYWFMLVFCAAVVNGQVNLLPPSNQPERILKRYPESSLVSDVPSRYESLGGLSVASLLSDKPGHHEIMPGIPAEQLVAIAFTSGSTGEPSPNEKNWGALVSSASRLYERFVADMGPEVGLVATVPPQHMYGMEMTVMMSLHGGCVLHTGRPFFPSDIVQALHQVDIPRLLVTTPVHLRAIVSAGLEVPALKKLICSTAPLTVEAASSAEEVLGVNLYEIFGSTETGSIATRRTTAEDAWLPLENIVLRPASEGWQVSGTGLPETASLMDKLELESNGRFRFIGRAADMINVAGKRISIPELTAQLMTIESVSDAFVFLPDGCDRNLQRPSALVVSELSEQQILGQASKLVDPVFLPRPLIKVDSIPRNATGKVTRELLQECLRNANAKS